MGVTLFQDVHQIRQYGQATVDIAMRSVPLLALPGILANVTPRIMDAGGQSISFPYWDTSLDGFTKDSVVDSRTGVQPSKMSLKTYDESAELKTISVDLPEYLLGDAADDPMEHFALLAGHQLGVTIQTSCFRKGFSLATGSPLVLDTGAETVKTMTVDAILDGGLKWGEKRSDQINLALLMHTKQFNDLAKTADYKGLAARGDSGIVEAGLKGMVVGSVHNIPIALCDSLPSQAGIVIDSITRAGSVATVTTVEDHGLQTGEKISIEGATEVEYNVANATITVTGDKTFTYAVSGTPATPATGSPAIKPRYTAGLFSAGAFGLYLSNEPSLKKIDHAGSVVVTIDSHWRFSTTLFRHNPRRLVRIVTH